MSGESVKAVLAVFFDGVENGIGNVEMPAPGSDLNRGLVCPVEVGAAADEKPVLFCKPLDVLFLAGGVGRVDRLDAVEMDFF